MVNPFRVENSVIEHGDNQVHLLKVEGELDMSNVAAFRERIDAVVDGTGRSVVLDLSSLEFIDSSGLAAVVQSSTRCPGLTVAVAPGSHVARIFEISGIGETLPLRESRSAAIAALE